MIDDGARLYIYSCSCCTNAYTIIQVDVKLDELAFVFNHKENLSIIINNINPSVGSRASRLSGHFHRQANA
jgi:hypothetical protein